MCENDGLRLIWFIKLNTSANIGLRWMGYYLFAQKFGQNCPKIEKIAGNNKFFLMTHMRVWEHLQIWNGRNGRFCIFLKISFIRIFKYKINIGYLVLGQINELNLNFSRPTHPYTRFSHLKTVQAFLVQNLLFNLFLLFQK